MEFVSMYREKGLTLQQIADKLNSQKQKTPSDMKYARFHRTTINRLLSRYNRLNVKKCVF